MNKIIAIAFLAAGIVLIIAGTNAYHSVSSDVSRLFTDSPSNKAIWLLVSGAAAGIVGFFGLLQK